MDDEIPFFDNDGKSLFKHFRLSEFDCTHCGENKMDFRFIADLDLAREIAGIPFHITSGYRCPEHDKAVNGKGNHTQGLAADIKAESPRERMLIVFALCAVGFSRIGIARTFIHVDACPDRDRNRLWLYTGSNNETV